MNQDTIDDPALETHLRRVLHEVADHIDVAPARAASRVRARRRRRGGVVGGVAAAAIAVAGFAAWNFLDEGEIERIPVETAIQSGATVGGDWWLLPSTHQDGCGNILPGVEVVTAARNRPGMEWDTAGVAYGEPSSDSGCFVFDEQSWLSDPARIEYTRTRSGRQDDSDSEWISAMAVHPDVVAIEVTIDGSPGFTVQTEALQDRPDGPRFAAFSAPSDTSSIDIKLVDEAGSVLGQHTDAIPPRQ